MSQLPGFSVGEDKAIPITYERYYDLCSRFLNKKVFHLNHRWKILRQALLLLTNGTTKKKASGLHWLQFVPCA